MGVTIYYHGGLDDPAQLDGGGHYAAHGEMHHHRSEKSRVNLTTALRLGATPRVALAGGGKTTAMFMPARQVTSRVVDAATAHLTIEQAALADQHVFVDEATVLDGALATGVTLFTAWRSTTARQRD